jgi:hypothetical protein
MSTFSWVSLDDRIYLNLVKIPLTPVGNKADFIRKSERVPADSTGVVISLNRGERRRAHHITFYFQVVTNFLSVRGSCAENLDDARETAAPLAAMDRLNGGSPVLLPAMRKRQRRHPV